MQNISELGLQSVDTKENFLQEFLLLKNKLEVLEEQLVKVEASVIKAINGKTDKVITLTNKDIVNNLTEDSIKTVLKEDGTIITEDGQTLRAFLKNIRKFLENVPKGLSAGSSSLYSLEYILNAYKSVNTILTEDGRTLGSFNKELLSSLENVKEYVEKAILTSNMGVSFFKDEEDLLISKPTGTSPLFAYAFNTDIFYQFSNNTWNVISESSFKKSVKYVDKTLQSVKSEIDTSLKVLYDFYSYAEYPSFVKTDELGNILDFTEESALKLLTPFEENLLTFENLLKDTDKNLSNLSNVLLDTLKVQYDFFSYEDYEEFLQVNTEGKIVSISIKDLQNLSEEVKESVTSVESLKEDITKQTKELLDETSQNIEVVRKEVFSKLSVNLDFYSYEDFPDFVQINEDGSLLLFEKTDTVKEENTDIILDMYTYEELPNVLQITDKGFYINTLDFVFVKDFYTYSFEKPYIVTTSSYQVIEEEVVVEEKEDLDLTKIPSNLSEAEFAYFDADTLKRKTTLHPMYEQGNNEVIPTNKASVVYALFDKMVEDFPKYVTKSSIGASTKGVEMYQYKFSPPPKRISASMTQTQVRPARIMINAGIHGSEKNGIIAVMCFAYNLVYNWRDLAYYDELRTQCELVISPMMNVDGTNTITRKNANGVDCNRNFDWKWDLGGSTVTTSDNYRGTGPFTEKESQNYRDAVLAYPNADLYIDVHHGGEAEIMWLGSNIEENVQLLTNVGTEMTTYFHKHIRRDVDPQTRLLWVSTNGEGTAAGWMASIGKSSVLFEGVAASHANMGTTFRARKFNEECLLRIIYHGFTRSKLKRELQVL